MLAALLLAGMVAAPLGSAWLFVPARRRARTTGAWPAIRRFLLAMAGTTALAATVAGALRLLGVSRHNLVGAIAGVIFASLAWFPATRRWNARAHLCWASSVFLFVVYLTFALEWTFASHLGPASTAGGVLLWFFEVFAAVLSCAYLWEICDALGTEHWRRRVTPQVSFTARDTSSPSPSHHATSTTVPSSRARWGSSGGSRWTSSAAGTSGALPRTPNCRSACCGPAGPGCTWISPGALASCR